MKKKNIKETKEQILDALGDETTNQIVIAIKGIGKAYDLFEEIQNRYNLFDNCVIDEGNPFEIRIEGKNKLQINNFAKKLEKNYKIKPKVLSVPISDTILDEDRKEETGGFEV